MLSYNFVKLVCAKDPDWTRRCIMEKYCWIYVILNIYNWMNSCACHLFLLNARRWKLIAFLHFNENTNPDFGGFREFQRSTWWSQVFQVTWGWGVLQNISGSFRGIPRGLDALGSIRSVSKGLRRVLGDLWGVLAVWGVFEGFQGAPQERFRGLRSVLECLRDFQGGFRGFLRCFRDLRTWGALGT